MIEPGSAAPDFTAELSSGGAVSLGDLLADGPLILYFYPADFTPGCTKEACTIRDLHGDIASAGLRVIGVSPQGADSHERFREKHGLPFDLLCDTEKEVIRKYDVDGPMGIGTRRATFLIGQDGRIEDAVLADVRIGRHAEFIERAIRLRDASDAQS
ncbi:MAG: peroxiredoxin [Woeseiaceae bacterium]|nr:peroxiredoxin [Woeseiaceae bacterium]